MTREYFNIRTYGDLYSYLENYIRFGNGKTEPMIEGCDHKHTKSKEFCELNGINFDRLYKEVLKPTGGCCCDCEILMNTANRKEAAECLVQ